MPVNAFQRRILVALNLRGKHIYGGTVPADVVANRRAKDKAARVARRVQRRNAK
jgi:hypothetical protein